MFALSITNRLTARANAPRTFRSRQTRNSSSCRSPRAALSPRRIRIATRASNMSADMSGSGKSSSNEDKQKYAMADTNIVNERSGGTAGDMSATGKSSSTGDAYSLGDANIASQQGGGTVGRGSSASDAASLEPGMRPEKSMADKMQERDGGSGSAPDARSRITGDLMSGDDSEMMGRDEETLEKRHQAAGPGGGSATDQGSIPMDFKGDEARQQQSEMSAEM